MKSGRLPAGDRGITAADPLTSIERLREILTDYATDGREDGCPEEFVRLRHELLGRRTFSDLLPPFLQTCRSLGDFRGFIKQESPTYQGRRDFLRDAFDPVLTALEQADASPYAQSADRLVPHFLYQAESWKRPRRVVAKIKWFEYGLCLGRVRPIWKIPARASSIYVGANPCSFSRCDLVSIAVEGAEHG